MNTQATSLVDLALECAFYDRAHLSNDIKRNTGLAPTQLSFKR